MWSIIACLLLAGCFTHESLPDPMEASAERAAARGECAPEKERLYRAVVEFYLARQSLDQRPVPVRICVGVEEHGDIPRGLFVDPDIAALNIDRSVNPPLVGYSECRIVGGDGYHWLVLITEIQRWWDTPDEYDVYGQIFWWEETAGGKTPMMSDLEDSFHLVASYQSKGWTILREVGGGNQLAVEQKEVLPESPPRRR
jgi:hypothetical protein